MEVLARLKELDYLAYIKYYAKRLPVPILATTTGFLTLSNVYGGLGFTGVRHFSMAIGALVLILYFVKMALYPKMIEEEYDQVVPSSLYAGMTMALFIIANYLTDFWLLGGQILWAVSLAIYFIHIIVFTIKHAIPNFRKTMMVPSWHVTYNGIATAVVLGGPMGLKPVQNILAIYCIGIYLFLLPFMVVRIARMPIAQPVYHTQAVLLAPVSLSLVAYLNTSKNPSFIFVCFLFILLLATLAFILYKTPSFLAMKFTPTHAGITFPMAIGVVATGRMSAYLESLNYLKTAAWLKQLQGIQLYLTTIFVGYVFIRILGQVFGVDERIQEQFPDA